MLCGESRFFGMCGWLLRTANTKKTEMEPENFKFRVLVMKLQ